MVKIPRMRKHDPKKGLKKHYHKNRKAGEGQRRFREASGMLTRIVANDPFPQMQFRKLTYVDENIIGTTNVASPMFGTENLYNLNSIWDPYVAGGVNSHNTTALGCVELAALYYRYKVHAVDIDVTFYNPRLNTFTASADINGLIAGLIVNNPSSLANTLAGNDAGRVSKLPFVWTKEVPATGQNKVHFKQYLRMSTLFEMTNAQYKDDINNTTAGTLANPSTLTQLGIALADGNSNSTFYYCNYRVQITYYTQFYQRKDLAI